MSEPDRGDRGGTNDGQPVTGASEHITYQTLLDAFDGPGCPVCARIEQGSLKALEDLLYEQVTDPTTRARLVEARGLCNWHTWLLPRIRNSPVGSALISLHLLTLAMERLRTTEATLRPRGRWRQFWTRALRAKDQPLSLAAWWHHRTACPLCDVTCRSERMHVRALLDYLGEMAFGERFANSPGLCLPHLCQAVTLGRDHPNLPALLSCHDVRWSALAAELTEFIRKNDYRFASEAVGGEGSSWRRALEVLAGRRGIFGRDQSDIRATTTHSTT